MLTVLNGDCRDKLRELPDESVHCCVTSPPYYGLRDYGVGGQIGLEATPEAYIAEMVGVFREVKRVLRSDGTLWLNIGDSYAGSGKGPSNGLQPLASQLNRNPAQALAGAPTQWLSIPEGVKAKDLLGIPWMLAFALRADGWYLRSEIIWAKPNPMPESVTDRPTKAHEQVFLMAKSARYFYDAEAIREPGPLMVRRGNGKPLGGVIGEGRNDRENFSGDIEYSGRNRRTVWTIATAPYSDAHFATFPPKLVEPCVLAGTSARGCCAACGAPWERVVESTPDYAAFKEQERQRKNGGMRNSDLEQLGLTRGSSNKSVTAESVTTGWQPTCTHVDADIVPCSVLDPFAGSGTVGKVALELGRRAILIELNPKYCEMIERRNQVTLGLPGLA